MVVSRHFSFSPSPVRAHDFLRRPETHAICQDGTGERDRSQAIAEFPVCDEREYTLQGFRASGLPCRFWVGSDLHMLLIRRFNVLPAVKSMTPMSS